MRGKCILKGIVWKEFSLHFQQFANNFTNSAGRTRSRLGYTFELNNGLLREECEEGKYAEAARFENEDKVSFYLALPDSCSACLRRHLFLAGSKLAIAGTQQNR